MSDYLKPSSKGIRDPLSTDQQNGRITNPPRWAQIGGLKNRTKAFFKNAMGIRKPGDTK